MSADAIGGEGPRILAVLVLYGRGLNDARAWSMLRQWLDCDDGAMLQHCLVYDNSPMSGAGADGPSMDVTVIRNHANGGTAAAYTTAISVAQERACDWLLLLDQDTELPPDYLELAVKGLRALTAADVLVPQVQHGDAPISPAVISARGVVRPGTTVGAGSIRTAISSGLLIRRDALASVLPFPPAIWLDYVDHWIFRRFAKDGRVIGDIDVVLTHDLSVRSPGRLPSARLRNILDAEAAFFAYPGGTCWLRLRRLARAARYFATGHLAHGVLVLYRAVWIVDARR